MSQNSNGQFNSEMLKKVIKMRLQNQLDKIPSPRCIYSQTNIIDMINFAYDLKFEFEYFSGKIYSLEYDHEAADVDKAPNVIYFFYPNPIFIDMLGSMVLKNQSANIKKGYWVYFVPFANFLCMKKIEELGIANKIKLKNMNFDFIPMNQDLFSLQFPKYLDPLEQQNLVMESMLKMNKIVGKFKNCFALGKSAAKIMKNLETSLEGVPEMQDASDDSYMIVLDRALDYVTPMMTSFTYQGLLDLFFGINWNRIQIPGNLMNSTKPMDFFILYSQKDIHYKKIALMHIKDVPDYLIMQSDKLTKKIKEKADNFQEVRELRMMQQHKNIVAYILTHLNECQFINTATLQAALIQSCQRAEETEYLSIFYPIEQVIKLEVLSSQVSDIGNYFSRFEKKIYQFVLDSYHPKHILTVRNLVDKGIIRSTKHPLKWKQICEKYDLIPDQPRCYTFIHIIYSALLVRFVEMFVKDNLTPDNISLLSSESWSKGTFRKIRTDDKVYIYLIGGITYSQIEAFRMLGQKLKLKFILCTTEVTSGKKIIQKCF